jgi:hypothetical protein
VNGLFCVTAGLQRIESAPVSDRRCGYLGPAGGGKGFDRAVKLGACVLGCVKRGDPPLWIGYGCQNGVSSPQEMAARWWFRGRGGRLAGGLLPVTRGAPVVTAGLACLFFIVSWSHKDDFSVDKTPLLF